jgi:murein DD-endopeptidase MepM/ murein hydrolase activator NlpD
MRSRRLCAVALLLAIAGFAEAQPPAGTMIPLVRTVDLNLGESADVTLADGKTVRVKLLDLQETRDPIRDALRLATVQVEVDGVPRTLESANYRLPQTVGAVQIDCPITKGYNSSSFVPNQRNDIWGLVKDARLRLWPAGSPWVRPGTFGYPARQRWFAGMTQMANEPVYVDGGETPANRRVYYHYGLDVGGSEAQVEVVAATDGQVVSAASQTLPGFENTPVAPRYDVIYLVDERGWFYRYSHLYAIDVQAGDRVKLGQKLGLLGKEGGSGGWSHLHFDITSRQPSGLWGIQDGYAYLWEAYQRQYQPELIAVARPHAFVRAGETATLDGSRSWARAGIVRHEWTLSDGSAAAGVRLTRTYSKPGSYSEILKITDLEGRVDYDFAVVQVLDNDPQQPLPPTIHAAYWPTQGIQPGDEVTFKVRTFRTTDGEEVWNFGDATPHVTVKSDGTVKPLAKDGYAITTHRFEKAGQYLVSVSRTNAAGMTATARLHVQVEPESKGARAQAPSAGKRLNSLSEEDRVR